MESPQLGQRVKLFESFSSSNVLTLGLSLRDSITKVWPEIEGLSDIFAVPPFSCAAVTNQWPSWVRAGWNRLVKVVMLWKTGEVRGRERAGNFTSWSSSSKRKKPSGLDKGDWIECRAPGRHRVHGRHGTHSQCGACRSPTRGKERSVCYSGIALYMCRFQFSLHISNAGQLR